MIYKELSMGRLDVLSVVASMIDIDISDLLSLLYILFCALFKTHDLRITFYFI